MTFEQLQHFLAIAKYKNYSIAAEESFVSQSSLSKQIKALEEELGFKLFDRTTRNIELTEGGEEFVMYSKRILQEYKEMLSRLRRYTDESKNTLRIAAIPVMNHYGLTDIIFHFQQQYPGVRVKVLEKDGSYVVQDLEKGDADLVFLRSHHIPEGEFLIYPLIDDELVLITGQDHRFSNRDEIELKEAEDEEFLFLGANTGMHQTCIKACKMAGFIPKERCLDLRSSTIKNLVANGQGISLMMKASIEYMKDPRIHIVYLKEHPIVNLALATKEEKLSDVSRTFIEYVQDSFGHLTDGEEVM
ncbi:LysR family transcriptional regulator [Lactonifactor longoviformis]|uniref:DNA-binding transcriptional regulator, LysR family n=1 Tax=Lactonifactor longoviformis DSM 17459 TaxID=1122155 RepID=A0A1M5ACP0_9CLOT|nr:LysR family transcriptional regulator [Lactonifactor longoviformis]POP32158.1 LysR family transcriptional regulator [Lactonifactor longoviformis]SHF28033.1 DNA-binding transcriptional regulator, LysR family [Lactonifactor longoviformis DSM 17459]